MVRLNGFFMCTYTCRCNACTKHKIDRRRWAVCHADKLAAEYGPSLFGSVRYLCLLLPLTFLIYDRTCLLMFCVDFPEVLDAKSGFYTCKLV